MSNGVLRDGMCYRIPPLSVPRTRYITATSSPLIGHVYPPVSTDGLAIVSRPTVSHIHPTLKQGARSGLSDGPCIVQPGSPLC